jgi:hypothetical protein
LLFLLRVHADHRLAVGLLRFDLFVDVTELGIPIWMLDTFQRFRRGLQTEPVGLQQSTDRRRRDRMPGPGQLVSQVSQRLGRPPQRRDRIAPLVRLHQAQQRLNQARVVLPRRLPASARSP